MYQNLIEEAHKEGLKEIVIEAAVQKSRDILLIEVLGQGDTFYVFPHAVLREGEGISQGIERAVIAKTGMQLKEVKRFLGHYDKGEARHYCFVVEVKDPYSLENEKGIAYAWLEPQEAIGYPITGELRKMLDLYQKT